MQSRNPSTVSGKKKQLHCDVSKDVRHVLRLAVVLQVFYDQLKNSLTGEDLVW